MRAFEWGVLGGGQMGFAIKSGAVKAGVIRGSDVIVSDPVFNKQSYETKWKSFGAKCKEENKEVIQNAKFILLSVKPQILPEIADELAKLEEDQTVISVIAGQKLDKLESLCGKAKVVRVMVNTACSIGHGAAALCANDAVTAEDFQEIQALFNATNGAVDILPEKGFDAFTALSGSGIAYVYMMAEAMADAGVHGGLSRDYATKVAVQTILGAAQMAAQTEKHPAILKDAVTSPGGCTMAGVRTLEKLGYRSTIIEAIIATQERCQNF